MIKIYKFVLVQTEKENTKYFVNGIINVKTKWGIDKYLQLQDCKTYRHKSVKIGSYAGNKRLIISESIKNGVESSNKFIVAKIICDVIYIEN